MGLFLSPAHHARGGPGDGRIPTHGRSEMRRSLFLAALGGLFLANAGCFIPIYPSDPTRRMEAFLNNSEDLRQIESEWSRFWFTDQPSHMTLDRIHGGLE